MLWRCYREFVSGFSMLWCSSWVIIPVFVLPWCAFKFGTRTCSLPIATKQYLLVWPASVSSSGIVMPEEDTHTRRVICPNKHWKYVDRSETVTVSVVLMTNMFIRTSFFQLATQLKDLFRNLYAKHVFQSTNSICLTFFVIFGVFSCVMVYINRPKPVARRLLLLDVGVPCLSGVNTDEDQGGGADFGV